jgi:hypothetical protein
MKTPTKMLVCAIAGSIVLLACGDGSNISGNIGKNNPQCKIKALSKTCNDDRCWYDESDSAYFRPYDHNWVRIEESIKEWMEEQFATESNDTGLFNIVDLFIHENYFNTLDIDGPIEREYYVDGKRVSQEEYNDSAAKIQEYYEERINRGKRDLPIPDPIFYETHYSTSSFYMGVPMTAKEIANLTENYKQLSIELYRDAVDADEIGGNGDGWPTVDIDDDAGPIEQPCS